MPTTGTSPIVYLPWSEQVMNYCLEHYFKGELPALDLELSARCDHGTCLYCDSKVGKPQPNELTATELFDLMQQSLGMRVKWVYICGLGEPANDENFFNLLEFLHTAGIEVSIFTNALYYSKEDIKTLKRCNANLIVKLDTFVANTFDRILGRKGAARKIYQTVEELLKEGFARPNENSETDLAFSIVPTSWTLQDIPEVVRFCKKNNIFPSIGELEFSGRAKRAYNDLSVRREELVKLKAVVEEILDTPGYCYERPLCPAIISGLHIANTGECIVDRETGLSCKWFSLVEPDMVSIGNIRYNSVASLDKKLREYRKEHLGVYRSGINDFVPNIFGGCGGKPEKIIELVDRLILGN